jgi:zinc protease
MSRAVESLGGNVTGFSGRNTLGLEASFMASNWREGLALFTELLTSPAFSEEDFQSRKAEHISYLLSLEESLPNRLFKILRLKLFRGHPYDTDAEGLISTVEAIKREDLVAFYGGLVQPGNIVVSVAGDLDPDEFVLALEEGLAGWAPPGDPPKAAIPPAPPAVKGPGFVSESLDRAQTHLALAFLAPAAGHRDQAAMDVLSSALSGMGGILFQELREKRSLAYSVSGGYSAGLGVGSYSLYIGTSPDKAKESLEGMLAIVGSLREGPLPLEAVEGAKRYLLGLNKMRHQTLASRASEALNSELSGLGLPFYDAYQESIAGVTPEDILRVARLYLSPDSSVLAVVGTEASVEAARAVLPKPKPKP